MLCSVELPVKYLELSFEFDFDFVIASTCLENPTYLDYYLKRRRKRFTILDNGAFETGEAIDDITYINLAHKLLPDVLVIPDVIKNPKETLIRYNKFQRLWSSQQVQIPNVQLMGVLQAGANIDYADILVNQYLSTGVEWIGIPYASGLDRYQLIKKHPEWKNVHILGLPHLSEVFSLLTLPNVKSIDSSLPVKASMDKKELLEHMAAATYASSNETKIEEYLLRKNLRQFKNICSGYGHIIVGA